MRYVPAPFASAQRGLHGADHRARRTRVSNRLAGNLPPAHVG